jgi:hypothetical protein
LAGTALDFVPGAAPLVTLAKIIGTVTAATSPKPDANSIGSVLEGLIGNPSTLVQAKQIEANFTESMNQMGFASMEELAELAEKDRESARNREVATKDWYPKALATFVVVMCLWGEWTYFHYGAPSTAAPELVGRILGTLDSALILVLGYYFGSSAGSSDKTAILAQMSQKLPNT